MSTIGFVTAGAWLLALLWVLPLVYALWTAVHPAAYEVRFDVTAPLTLENFAALMPRLAAVARTLDKKMG